MLCEWVQRSFAMLRAEAMKHAGLNTQINIFTRVHVFTVDNHNQLQHR
jgi:hypothetical protein